MIAYVAVLATPYFQVTGREGHALLKNLPAGQYTVEVWQPSLRGAPETLAKHVDAWRGRMKQFAFYFGSQAGFRAKRARGSRPEDIAEAFDSAVSRADSSFFLFALLTLLQSATYLLVRHANRQHALAQIESSLLAGAQISRN